MIIFVLPILLLGGLALTILGPDLNNARLCGLVLLGASGCLVAMDSIADDFRRSMGHLERLMECMEDQMKGLSEEVESIGTGILYMNPDSESDPPNC